MEKKSYFVTDFELTRNSIVTRACFDCLNDMYKAAYPSITWEDYENLHKGLSKEELEGKHFYKAYYLPEKVYKEIQESYASAYDLKSHLPSIIDILKDYFKKPIVDKYIEGKDGYPGHRGYDHPKGMSKKSYEEVCKFLDMANDFYNWNSEYNSFLFTVMNYSPCSNRETVENWWHENGQPDFKLPDESYWDYEEENWEDEDTDADPIEDDYETEKQESNE